MSEKEKLKQLALSEENLTTFNLSNWIESKTNNKLTVIEKDFLLELIDALDQHVEAMTNINQIFRQKWLKVFSRLRLENKI